jgi:glutamate formiminotransferase
LFECVINISEGQRLDVLDALSAAAGASLRDRHSDAVHNRSVFTLIHDHDELRRDVHALAVATMNTLDLRAHVGVHPRFGVLDVVPYVALDEARTDQAVALRDETAAWLATTFEIPVFLYGPLGDGTTRSLPDVRRGAFRTLKPDWGPASPDVKSGASALGARGLLVAWNLWVRGISLDDGKAIAKAVRRVEVRALALPVREFTQISCNLIAPLQVGPSTIYDQVRGLLASGVIDHAELVGLIPEALLRAEDSARWEQLDLSYEKTIEARLL